MILRRITKHVKDQNWFAVGLDFFIVVAGVLLAIQVSNWNERGANHAEYQQALKRLEAEITDNLAIIEREDLLIGKTVNIARAGLDALLACTGGAEAVAKTNAALAEARGAIGIQLQFPALRELTTNSILLSEQSDAQRKRFAALLFRLELARETSARYEPIPLREWPAHTPTLAIGPAEKREGVYFGQAYEIQRYPLVLKVDMATACQDKELLKWLHNWEVWQSNVTLYHQQLRHEYLETQKLLEGIQS